MEQSGSSGPFGVEPLDSKIFNNENGEMEGGHGDKVATQEDEGDEELPVLGEEMENGEEDGTGWLPTVVANSTCMGTRPAMIAIGQAAGPVRRNPPRQRKLPL